MGRTFVIVGAGLAGATAAGALRTQGHTGRIVLIGAESEFPYDRLPLSKDYLKDRSEKAKLYLHPQRWYSDQNIELRRGCCVTAIDRATHDVVLRTGERVGYDKLLLATGASVRRLNVPGDQLHGVLYLRNIADCEAIKAAFATAGRVVIIGAGWVGLETAVAARLAGCDVTVLGAGDLPLAKPLGHQVAGIYAALHRRHGVRFQLGVAVAELTGDGGRVTGVRLADGAFIGADVVIVGIGAVANTALAEGCGLVTDDGVVVDEHLATADPDIFAAGDVASCFHPSLGIHLRLGHWSAARKQPPVAAAGMMGRAPVYDNVPYFFSDQYELGMEYLGYVPPDTAAEVVVRGDLATGRFIVFWLAGERVLAGMNVNIWHLTAAIRALVSSGARVDRSKLADPAVPLGEVSA
ncbi:FAD-dependent oxidoreductase [Parafrigoribacterium mesophilum]|uniref:NAD(P)/FAD-dependent oxidoreductase n=1 Tax=Parafrigoribacterium mesophilum TaxID=433646 RepID=UPI0031FD4A2C